jgi:hypothetical protein
MVGAVISTHWRYVVRIVLFAAPIIYLSSGFHIIQSGFNLLKDSRILYVQSYCNVFPRIRAWIPFTIPAIPIEVEPPHSVPRNIDHALDYFKPPTEIPIFPRVHEEIFVNHDNASILELRFLLILFSVTYSARSFSSSLFEVAPLRADGSPHELASKKKEAIGMLVLNAKEETVLRHLEELGL